MCEPTTIAGVSIAAGTLVNAYGQYQAGKAQQKIDENNARLAEQQAGFVEQQGAQQAGTVLTQGRNTAGQARMAAAASGVDPNSGSAATAATASGIASEIDAARAKSNAAREAWGYKQQAQDLRTQGKLARKQGLLNAIGGGLSGAGQIAATYKGSQGGG